MHGPMSVRMNWTNLTLGGREGISQEATDILHLTTLSFSVLLTEGLWQLCVEQVYQCYFSVVCAHFLSLCHTLISSQYFKLFHYYYERLLLCLLWWSMIIDLWWYYCIGLGATFPNTMENLINKCVCYECFTTLLLFHFSYSPWDFLYP